MERRAEKPVGGGSPKAGDEGRRQGNGINNGQEGGTRGPMTPEEIDFFRQTRVDLYPGEAGDDGTDHPCA